MGISAQRAKKDKVDPTSSGVRTAVLREAVADALERLSQHLVAHTSREVMMARPDSPAPAVQDVQDAIRFFGQVAAAWADVPDDALPPSGAGFGSTVVVEDLDHGVREAFTLMAGALLDIDAGQVSLASPIGSALLGAHRGDVIRVQTPHRLRRLRVVAVRTLSDRLAQGSPLPAA